MLRIFKAIGFGVCTLLVFSAPSTLLGQGSTCRDTTAYTKKFLQEIRFRAWDPDSITTARRVLLDLPTIPDSAAADTAVVAVTDTIVCQQALTRYNAESGLSAVSAVFVVRQGNRYLVLDPGPGPKPGGPVQTQVLDMAFVFRKGFLM
jgi:hypothetical protein